MSVTTVLKKINSSYYSALIFGILIFSFFLVLNVLTPYVCDDFVYLFSFSTKERLTNIADVFPSMYVHAFRMNGRIVSHSLVQIFAIFPPLVFDVVSSAVSTFIILFLGKVFAAGKFSLVKSAASFAVIWCFTPDFGQSWLWQDGAANYMWSIAILLLFIFPFLKRYGGGEPLKGVALKILFAVFAYLCGFYSEIASFVAMFIAVSLLIGDRILNKKSLRTYLWVPIASAAAGYVSMFFMPAQVSAKSGGLSFSSLLHALEETDKFFRILMIVWAAVIIRAFIVKIEKKRIFLSFIFFAGGLGAGLMLGAALYIAPRCFSVVPVLFIAAILTVSVKQTVPFTVLSSLALAALAVFFMIRLIPGVASVSDSFNQFKNREAIIEQEKEQGIKDHRLPIVTPLDQYSAFWGLRDLSLDDPDTWPNKSMAQYYGTGSIIGYDPGTKE